MQQRKYRVSAGGKMNVKVTLCYCLVELMCSVFCSTNQ